MLRNIQLRDGVRSFFFFFLYLVQGGIFYVAPLFLSVALGLSAVATSSAATLGSGHAPSGRWRHNARKGSAPTIPAAGLKVLIAASVAGLPR